MTTTEEEIDLIDITRNNSTPIIISITKARREISRQLQSRVCADPHIHDHGHSYIVWSNSDWLKKRQVTSQIVPPTNPGRSIWRDHTPIARSPQSRTISMEKIQAGTISNKKDDHACIQMTTTS
jgi:hypothetical protein